MMIPVTSPEREKTVFPSYKIYLYGREQRPEIGTDSLPTKYALMAQSIGKFITFLELKKV